jgi:hypothetical protein
MEVEGLDGGGSAAQTVTGTTSDMARKHVVQPTLSIGHSGGPSLTPMNPPKCRVALKNPKVGHYVRQQLHTVSTSATRKPYRWTQAPSTLHHPAVQKSPRNLKPRRRHQRFASVHVVKRGTLLPLGNSKQTRQRAFTPLPQPMTHIIKIGTLNINDIKDIRLDMLESFLRCKDFDILLLQEVTTQIESIYELHHSY